MWPIKRVNDYVEFCDIGNDSAKPSPTGHILLLGYSAREEYAEVPTFAGDGKPYLYAILRGVVRFYLTSQPTAYTRDVARFHLSIWNCAAIKCFKHLIRENHSFDLINVLLLTKIYTPPK